LCRSDEVYNISTVSYVLSALALFRLVLIQRLCVRLVFCFGKMVHFIYLTRIGLIEIKKYFSRESWPKNGKSSYTQSQHNHTPSLAKAFIDTAACFECV